MAAKTCLMAEKRCHGGVSKQCTPPSQTEGQGSQWGLKPSGIVGRRGPSWWAYGRWSRNGAMAAKTCLMAEKRCHGGVSKHCTHPSKTEVQGSQWGLKPSGIVGRRGPSWWAYGTRLVFLRTNTRCLVRPSCPNGASDVPALCHHEGAGPGPCTSREKAGPYRRTWLGKQESTPLRTRSDRR